MNRIAFLMLLLATLGACGGGEDPEDTPAVTKPAAPCTVHTEACR